jgi:hypothetical protein
MSLKINSTQLSKLKTAYKRAFEDLLMVAPELELVQKSALNEDYMRRFFARIECGGLANADFEAVHFRITSAKLGILNNRHAWEMFLSGKQQKKGSLL